ncbi:hypothetical protein H5410_027312 [Solanum commersonii]|uniref:DUF4283 domain-containing protein n=1 Tax=Solanum commersonii TaxID=4109 RepID=A0A9J5Z317_SOLCO|nr:hypothetical protein H5410_027312 [Solanum commersonii]
MSIAGKVMRIQVWTPNFKPVEETPIVPIWISLSKLPWHCYNKEFVTGLLSPIGKVLYLDSASIKKTRGNLESDCTIRQKDEEKKKKELDNVRNMINKDIANNQQQPKGYKETGHKEDATTPYNQQRDQGQRHEQQEDQWQTQKRGIIINNRYQGATPTKWINPPNRQESPPPLEEMDKYNGSKGVSRPQTTSNQQYKQRELIEKAKKNIANSTGKEVSIGHADTCIDLMLPTPKPFFKVVNVVEEADGGRGVQKGGGGELTHVRHEELEFDHTGDSRVPATPNRIKQITGTQEIIDIGQQPRRFNNKSGERLSKQRREAIKKRMQRNTSQDPNVIDTGQQTKEQVLPKDQQGEADS